MNEDGHVSIPRRGYIAAGLAVAVVGSLGVISTMNAGAAEVAPSRAAAAAAAVAAATVPGTLQPPPELPWGGRPTPLKKGPAGASSEALAATGADIAAAPGRNGIAIPQPEFNPKGDAPRKRMQRNARTAVPPRPPLAEPLPAQSPVAEPPEDDDPVKYHYANAFQYTEVDGTYANLVISKPKLAQEDYHSLAEIAVQSADGNQVVEVGWTVDRGVNEGSDEPHLFVYHWVNDTESCYNACGFVQYSKTVAPGLKLPLGPKRFGIEFYKGAWWIAYDSEWLGYFPAALWRNKGVEFTKTGLVQWFGEVAAATTEPCTQMGTGSTPDKSSAARIGTISLIVDNKDVPPAYSIMTLSEDVDTPVYTITPVSERTARYGGNGHRKCAKPEEG